MKYEITIVADTNDGDYITQVSEISEEDLEIIKPLIKTIKEFKPYRVEYESKYAGLLKVEHYHNYPFDDCLRRDMGEKSPEELYNFNEEVFNIFEDHIPCSEYGIHTIKSISVCPLQKKTKLL